MELRGEHRVNYSLTFECHTSIFEGCFSNELAAGCCPAGPNKLLSKKFLQVLVCILFTISLM
jgi:hypothetical protein